MAKPCIACGNDIDGKNNSYCKKCDAARNRRYYEANKEKENARRHKYYRENKEFAKGFIKAWRDNNPEKVRASSHRRRAREKNAITDGWTESQVMELYGDNCHICGEKIDLSASRWAGRGDWERGLQFDHVIPLSKGGTDTIDNIRPSHGLCNIVKGNKINAKGPSDFEAPS